MDLIDFSDALVMFKFISLLWIFITPFCLFSGMLLKRQEKRWVSLVLKERKERELKEATLNSLFAYLSPRQKYYFFRLMQQKMKEKGNGGLSRGIKEKA